MFELHPTLARDGIFIADLPLCRVMLANDSRYPWVILVPRRAQIREIYELEKQDQLQLHSESVNLSRAMAELYQADKMNVAALGNMVPQLHIHHVARYESDAAWPGPIWGALPAIAYGDEQREIRVNQLSELIASLNINY